MICYLEPEFIHSAAKEIKGGVLGAAALAKNKTDENPRPCRASATRPTFLEFSSTSYCFSLLY